MTEHLPRGPIGPENIIRRLTAERDELTRALDVAEKALALAEDAITFVGEDGLIEETEAACVEALAAIRKARNPT